MTKNFCAKVKAKNKGAQKIYENVVGEYRCRFQVSRFREQNL
jgi:hypothetical protein